MALVPIDEGEAEAQPDLPPITITLMHEGGQQAPWPWTVRFTVPVGASLRRRELAEYLLGRAREWAEGMDYAMADGSMGPLSTDEGPVLALTTTVTGYRS